MSACDSCGFIGSPRLDGTCPNCRSPLLPKTPASPREAVVELPELGDMQAVEAGFRAALAAVGEDPDRPELVGVTHRAASAFAALTRGYDTDVVTLFEPLVHDPASDQQPKRATLSLEVPVRAVCERCLLPMFGSVQVSCQPRAAALDGGHLARLSSVLAARLQNEAQLAEQVAAAVVDLGGAAWAEVEVQARRPCDECGGGRVTTTASARRPWKGKRGEMP